MIKEITSKQEWDNVLSKVDTYDFYHTYDYHIISKQEDEECVLLQFEKDNYLIAIPLIIRPIKGTDYFDITSVYGYSGPVSKNISYSFNNTQFITEFKEYLFNKKIVSVFSRLNPFINHQKDILKNLGDCEDLSSVVFIDLTNDIEVQRQGYQRRIKSHINKSRRLCTIKKAQTQEEIEAFIDIYYENMNRVDAEDSYYFDKDYFFKFLKCNDFKTDLLLAIDNETNQYISGVMFVKTNQIVQYHLSGTKTDFLNIMPVKMLIDEMRILATNKGYKYLNLGGGLGSKEDSLLRFKKSFSKELETFSLWKYIVNVDAYNKLSSKNEVTNTNYFPAYRSK
ncbi:MULTISPECIES: peptidoglycan bridge formation glycyltransferase FemA/FemB family protein [Gaetbulibacter]|uniref:peptidoglycan bridge formation glycyltransferase FemA/FemB family protein n=1 Tax=Gaetbulibacter TaxID=311207 RepID=UPI0021D01A98|nr:peptidoglycan bridge formation glycyltransferase FemA/FemB family protein [Gaetbulibacter sp. NE]